MHSLIRALTRALTRAAALTVLMGTASAQQFTAFEVATIKPVAPDWNGGRYIRMRTAHELEARNHALRTLLAAAYNLSPHVISGGPGWVDTERFDILAKAPGDKRPELDDQMAMLRALLAERFQVQFRREIREMPVFALVTARTGAKLKETPATDLPPSGPPLLAFHYSPKGMELPARHVTMGDFASILQRSALDRPVLDKTGLTAKYDFDLEWAHDETQFGGQLGKAPEDSDKPGLFTAIQQQLGLRLEATRGPVEVMIVERAERPTAN